MGTISRSVKQGGLTSLQDGQIGVAADVEDDMAALFALINGEIDHENVKTGEAPGPKSWRFTEISAPSSPSANDILQYAFDVGSTTILAAKDSGGTVVDLSRRIGARVYNDANISVNNNSATALTFNTERYDVGACHDTGSNTGRLTAPIAGKYLITGHIRLASDTDYTQVQLIIRLNGTTSIADVFDNVAFSANVVDRSVSTIYALAATDYVELVAFQINTSAGANNVSAAGNLSPEFAMHYVGN
jgi:hypothetical protein